jgi:TRAP-type C4-dicarboxylate transport system substrate-binding protein
MTRITKASFVAAIAALFSAAASAQTEIRMTITSGHAPVFPWVKHVKETFIPAVDRELAKSKKYKIVWNEAFGGVLAKIGSELETIEQGVSDIGLVCTACQPGRLILQNVTYAAPFGPSDVTKLMPIVDNLNRKNPAMLKVWDSANQVYLAGFAAEDQDLMSSSPILKFEDLNGKKFGAPGSALPWLRGTGAVGVVAALPSYYNDIKAGLYNGVISIPTGVAPAKLYEVAPYWTRISFGAMVGGALNVNKAKWNSLPPEVKTALQTSAAAWSKAYFDDLTVRVKTASDTYAKQGRMMQFPEAERVKLAKSIENPTKGWIAEADKLGLPGKETLKAYMDAVRAGGMKFARDWDRE